MENLKQYVNMNWCSHRFLKITHFGERRFFCCKAASTECGKSKIQFILVGFYVINPQHIFQIKISNVLHAFIWRHLFSEGLRDLLENNSGKKTTKKPTMNPKEYSRKFRDEFLEKFKAGLDYKTAFQALNLFQNIQN